MIYINKIYITLIINMILYMLYLIGFVVFTVDLVIIWVNWIASQNSTVIFFILTILKF